MSLTTIEAANLRVEKVLPYLQNAQGISLVDLLTAIDNKLKDASPDALTPSLINWTNKNLFADKFVQISGFGLLNYNEFGLSKIGKGRFQVTGNGLWEYDRLVPVSDTRGAVGKIYLGATHPANVSVGVRCYDADKQYLGTNGGGIFNGSIPAPLNAYRFYKSSIFGESGSGLRFLKPDTRFVKLFIEVTSNTGTVFFDESELTTFELDERYKQVFGSELDWNEAEFFYSEVAINTNFTFLSDLDGKVKTVFVKNTGASNINVTCPAAKWQGGMPLTLVRPGKQSGFTFIKAGGVLFASVIEELE